MHQHQVKGAPIYRPLEDILEISAATEVELVALDAVVHMIKRIQIAHLDLDWNREFEIYGFHLF